VNRTLNALHNLGNQRFVLSPFSEHLDRWQANLQGVLSEFESNPGITVDNQFAKELLQILANIDLELEKRRYKEAHGGEATKSLSDNKILLERIEEDHAAATKEIKRQKNAEIKRLSDNVESIKEELDRIAQMRTGIFRAISKNAKTQKETEAKQRLNTAQNELASAVQYFTAEQEKLQTEYERRKQATIKQIQDDEEEIENQEIDSSMEARRATCEALVSAVSSLLQRKKLQRQ
jgi:chromosome segregation ATPase